MYVACYLRGERGSKGDSSELASFRERGEEGEGVGEGTGGRGRLQNPTCQNQGVGNLGTLLWAVL